MKAAVYSILSVAVVGVVAYILVNFWPYIFAANVEGEVIKVEKLMQPMAVITRQEPSDKIFSFAVAIKDKKTGEIFTASSEDRQWAAVQGEGLCAKATFFKYPPWKFDKAGTYYGARLEKLWNCNQPISE